MIPQDIQDEIKNVENSTLKIVHLLQGHVDRLKGEIAELNETIKATKRLKEQLH